MKSTGMLLFNTPRRIGATISSHVSIIFQCLVQCMQVSSFMASCSLIFPTIHSITADNWRVILKADRLEYINASFANVNKCAFSLDCKMKCI